MHNSLVMIPGLNCTSALYAGQNKELGLRYNVYIPDLGEFSSISDMADYVLDTSPRTFNLLGLSMGGYVVLEMARKAPDRITSLMLLGTSARPDAPDRSAARRKEMDLATTGRFQEILDGYWPDLVHAARRYDQGLRRIYEAMAHEAGTEAFCRHTQAIIGRPDSRNLIDLIDVPTLVASGSDDRVTPPELAREMAGAIRGARLSIIPACGHLSTLERPGILSTVIGDFLDGQRRA